MVLDYNKLFSVIWFIPSTSGGLKKTGLWAGNCTWQLLVLAELMFTTSSQAHLPANQSPAHYPDSNFLNFSGVSFVQRVHFFKPIPGAALSRCQSFFFKKNTNGINNGQCAECLCWYWGANDKQGLLFTKHHLNTIILISNYPSCLLHFRLPSQMRWKKEEQETQKQPCYIRPWST